MSVTFTDAYRSFLRDSLPRGAWWQGPAADRAVEAFVQASSPLVEFLCTLYLKIWPFDADVAVLNQWYDYLFPDSCISRPTTESGLRDAILAALAAQDVSSASGLIDRIVGDLKFVEVDDLPGVSSLPLELPSPLDAASQVVEIWYAPTQYIRAIVECVGRRYSPATAVVRPVTPVLYYRAPGSPTQAQDIAVHWAELRPVSDILVQRFLLLGGLLETNTYSVTDEQGAATLDQLFPGLNAADDITAQRFEATARRDWYDQGKTVVLPTVNYP